MRKPIVAAKGAPPQGPYTPAIVADGRMVYISSQGSINPETGQRVEGPFAAKAKQVFDNITVLLEAAGTSWAHAVKVTVILNDWSDFAAMNEVYAQYVTAPYPARTTLQSNIGDRALLVDCIARVPD